MKILIGRMGTDSLNIQIQKPTYPPDKLILITNIMKRLIIIALLLTAAKPLFAQLLKPEIKVGTVVHYTAYLKNAGMVAELDLTFTDMNDPIKMNWYLPNYGKGQWEMPMESLNSAVKTRLEAPDPDGVTKMKKDETLLVLSKVLYAEAVKSNGFTINNIKFNILADTTVYRVNGKPLASFHALSDNKNAEMWILNNPNYPLIIASKNLTKGIDFKLTEIK